MGRTTTEPSVKERAGLVQGFLYTRACPLKPELPLCCTTMPAHCAMWCNPSRFSWACKSIQCCVCCALPIERARSPHALTRSYSHTRFRLLPREQGCDRSQCPPWDGKGPSSWFHPTGVNQGFIDGSAIDRCGTPPFAPPVRPPPMPPQ